MEIAHEFFEGHAVLTGIHRDKPHPHIHFIVLAIRSKDRSIKSWMRIHEKSGDVYESEYIAGAKYHKSNEQQRALNDFAYNIAAKYGIEDFDSNKAIDENKNKTYAEEYKTCKIS